MADNDSAIVENQDVYALDFSYPFLKNIDPHHLPRTITIPQKYLDAMANMERQYWEIKAQRYNVMIFFKKGAFYEFYDSDAVVAAREFGLKMVFDTTNRGKMRLAGVPEHSYNEWARLFVFRGYKVGRVEQMKVAPDTKAKVMPRELVEVLTPGTITDASMLSDHREIFVLSLVPCFDAKQMCVGVDAFAVDLSRRVVLWCPCLADVNELDEPAATSFSAAQIPDGALRTLTSLLHHLQPREIILPEVGEPKEFVKCVDSLAKWVEAETYSVDYFPPVPCASTQLAHSPKSSSARGLMENYFRSLSLEKHLPLFAEAVAYTAHTAAAAAKSGTVSSEESKAALPILTLERKFDTGLILDASTIGNLEIVANLQDGTEKHSLHAFLHCCETNGGKRLFRNWLLRPSASACVIQHRQHAVRFIVEQHLLEEWNPRKSATLTQSSDISSRKRSRDSDDVGSNVTRFSTVDFERILSRLADLKDEATNVSYVDPLVQYKRNLDTILKTVKAFSDMVQWAEQFEQKCRHCVQESGTTLPPLLCELLAEIRAATKSVSVVKQLFDADAAEANGVLIPSPGTSPHYDESAATVAALEKKLHAERLRLSSAVFSGAELRFTEIGHDIFLLEVELQDAPKMTPHGLVERNRTSKVVRYMAASTEKMIENYKKAAAEKSAALLSVLRNVAARMCQEAVPLFNASQALAYIDCLMGLADVFQQHPNVCFPNVVECEAGSFGESISFLDCQDLVHPLLLAGNPVPNSVRLDNTAGRLLVLTGPNMAGKSTIMRTTAINIILAQMGGPVFGRSMTLAPVDRVFTRIGARDASHKGQSTLYVELSETADILRYATSRSLCLIDELGRGTSTHDGMAIAHATLEAMKQIVPLPPLTLFSTHYHALAMEQARQCSHEELARGTTNVQLGYMDFSLTKQEDTGLPTVTFLYRLVRGICDRSYGVEVALMAGIPPSLVCLAKEKSDELLRRTAQQEDIQVLQKLMSA